MKITKLARIVNELSIRLNELHSLIVPLRLAAYKAENKQRKKIAKLRTKRYYERQKEIKQ